MKWTRQMQIDSLLRNIEQGKKLNKYGVQIFSKTDFEAFELAIELFK